MAVPNRVTVLSHVWRPLGLIGRFTLALTNPTVRERFTSLGVQPVGNTPEQWGAEIRADLARWSKVIKSAGIKVE